MSATNKSAINKPAIAMVPVTSSQVKAAGHDPITRTLAVEFKNGGLYHYSDVPAELFTKLRLAESVGAFLSANIKGKFKYTKVSA
jgi:hypothetical protein